MAVHTIILRDAWGKQVHKSTIGTAYLYTGRRWDELLGLYDYNARWYDPGTGVDDSVIEATREYHNSSGGAAGDGSSSRGSGLACGGLLLY